MNIVKTEIDGVLIIEPHLFRDARGYFFESFCKREFEEKVTPILDIVFISARQRVYEQLHREPNEQSKACFDYVMARKCIKLNI